MFKNSGFKSCVSASTLPGCKHLQWPPTLSSFRPYSLRCAHTDGTNSRLFFSLTAWFLLLIPWRLTRLRILFRAPPTRAHCGSIARFYVSCVSSAHVTAHLPSVFSIIQYFIFVVAMLWCTFPCFVLYAIMCVFLHIYCSKRIESLVLFECPPDSSSARSKKHKVVCCRRCCHIFSCFNLRCTKSFCKLLVRNFPCLILGRRGNHCAVLLFPCILLFAICICGRMKIWMGVRILFFSPISKFVGTNFVQQAGSMSF